MVCGYDSLKLSPHEELLVVSVLVDVLVKNTINKDNNPVNHWNNTKNTTASKEVNGPHATFCTKVVTVNTKTTYWKRYKKHIQ